MQNFSTYRDAICVATEAVAQGSMKKAATDIKDSKDESTDVSVTVEGTWIRRGHASKFGVVSVMSADNGKVLDREVLSKFCLSCSKGSEEQPTCQNNYDGTSGGMKPSGAIQIFEPQHGLCPKGVNSWCSYNRSLEDGKTYTHKHTLPEAVMTSIKPVYRDLTQPALLSKCLHGRTQNVNESLNR